MKLIQRIPTQNGPRTTVVQGLSREHAYALMHAAASIGGVGIVTEDGQQMSMSAHLRAINPPTTAVPTAPNVTVLRKRRK